MVDVEENAREKKKEEHDGDYMCVYGNDVMMAKTTTTASSYISFSKNKF